MNPITKLMLLSPKRDFAPLVASMFGAGEQGLVLVPSYGKSLFQDAAMTLPAVVGSPVVKALDLSGRGNHVTFANVTLEQDSAGKKYLSANGTSSAGQVTIDFSGTDEITAFAGVHKASDAARAMIFELGNGVLNSFRLEGPFTNGVGHYVFVSAGGSAATATALAAAPVTTVLTGIGDISGDVATIRANGAVAQASVADQGAGNYRNDVFNIFARNAGSLFFSGRLYGLIVRGAASTAGQIADAERYMARLSGVNF